MHPLPAEPGRVLGQPQRRPDGAPPLAWRGDVDGLRARADAGDRSAARLLADLLAQRGDVDEATEILRVRADAGDHDAARRLDDLLLERGDVAGLRTRADAGDRTAARLLADLLAQRGDVDGLRARADADDRTAALRLTGLLLERGDVDGLRVRADAGDYYAARLLPDLMVKQGRGEEAARLRQFGLNPDGSIAHAPRNAAPEVREAPGQQGEPGH